MRQERSYMRPGGFVCTSSAFAWVSPRKIVGTGLILILGVCRVKVVQESRNDLGVEL